MILTVNPLPIITITTLDSTLCIGDTANLTANGGINYQWINGPNSSNYSFVPSETEIYEVVGFNEFNCSDTSQITIVVNPLPNPLFESDINFGGCFPFAPIFTDLTGIESDGPESANVIWNFGNGDTSLQVGSTIANYTEYGCYDVTLTSITAAGCFASVTLNDYVCVNEIIADFIANPTEQQITNPFFEFINQSQNATSFEWNFGDSSIISNETHPDHTFDDVGDYLVTLVAFGQDGCTDTAIQIIQIKDEVVIHVPNTFTPNGDGLNELFIPILFSGYDRKTGYEFIIYNRWGEIIFNTDVVGLGWDGTYKGIPVPDGSYNWEINFKSSMNNEIFKYLGHVNLLR
jgi:gliding motility-associated-like protein